MHSIVKWLVDVSFRPPRHKYNEDSTVSVVTNGTNVYIRRSFSFKTEKGYVIYGSLWWDRDGEIPKNCLIYLHSLGTNQFESLNLVPFMCSPDICVAAFDLPGCGNSEGDYIPLDGSGIHVVSSAIDFLDKEFKFEQYGVWGRSLGAAIALQSVSRINRFSCCVADSSFRDTESVVYDQAVENNIPKFIVTVMEPVIKHQANNILKTNIISPSPMQDVPFSTTPLLMGHGKQDTFVPIKHAQTLFNNYGCIDKQLYIFDSRHNGVRPYQWYETAARFIYRKFGLTPAKRYYDSVFSASRLHSGNKTTILNDIDLKIEERRKSLQMVLQKAREEDELEKEEAKDVNLNKDEPKEETAPKDNDLNKVEDESNMVKNEEI